LLQLKPIDDDNMRKGTMMSTASRTGLAWLAVAAVGTLGAAPAMAQSELTVYTAVEAEDLKKYAERFNADHPDIEIKWVRDSTGIITAKLLAEKDNPQADLIWGLAATSLMLLKNEGMLEAYAPSGLDALDGKFRDSEDPPYWTGMDAWVAAICVNTVEAESNGLPLPTAGPDRPDLSGPSGDAQPQLLGHRLPRRLQLAADVRRG
jgi:iron(III) transport system substrate-binding protein